MWLKFKESCDTSTFGESCVQLSCNWLYVLSGKVLKENMIHL